MTKEALDIVRARRREQDLQTGLVEVQARQQRSREKGNEAVRREDAIMRRALAEALARTRELRGEVESFQGRLEREGDLTCDARDVTRLQGLLLGVLDQMMLYDKARVGRYVAQQWVSVEQNDAGS